MSSGSISTDAKFDLSVSAESLYASQGLAMTPSFLAGLTTDPAATPPAALTTGVNMLVLPTSTDYSEYTGTRSGKSMAVLRAAVSNEANWTSIINGDGTSVQPSNCVCARA